MGSLGWCAAFCNASSFIHHGFSSSSSAGTSYGSFFTYESSFTFGSFFTRGGAEEGPTWPS
jgi:hypothetical protein